MMRSDWERGGALDKAKTEIATRIRQVCQHFADDEFQKLIDRMAEIEVRYRMRAEWGLFRDPSRPPVKDA